MTRSGEDLPFVDGPPDPVRRRSGGRVARLPAMTEQVDDVACWLRGDAYQGATSGEIRVLPELWRRELAFSSGIGVLDRGLAGPPTFDQHR